jgi:hypothetical protein
MSLHDESEKASIVQLASAIREELELVSSRMYAQRISLPWLPMYICQDAIEQVLCGARQVLGELELHQTSLSQIPADELTPFWIKRIRAFLTESKRAAPRVVELQFMTIRDIAMSIYSAIKQRARNAHFLQYGPPPGVSEFPALSSLGKSKTLAVPWILAGNPRISQEKEYQRFMSHVIARRRVPGARAATCIFQSDTERPELYT